MEVYNNSNSIGKRDDNVNSNNYDIKNDADYAFAVDNNETHDIVVNDE